MIDMRKQIKKAMGKKKINIPEMARRIGCNQQTLYNYFAGGNITVKYIEAILKVLGGTLKFKDHPAGKGRG